VFVGEVGCSAEDGGEVEEFDFADVTWFADTIGQRQLFFLVWLHVPHKRIRKSSKSVSPMFYDLLW